MVFINCFGIWFSFLLHALWVVLICFISLFIFLFFFGEFNFAFAFLGFQLIVSIYIYIGDAVSLSLFTRFMPNVLFIYFACFKWLKQISAMGISWDLFQLQFRAKIDMKI